MWEADVIARFESSREVVLPKPEVTSIDVVQLLRDFAAMGEGDEEEEGEREGEGESDGYGYGIDGDEQLVSYLQEGPVHTNKRKRKKNKKKKKAHRDECVRRKVPEYDFEAELEKFSKEIEAIQQEANAEEGQNQSEYVEDYEEEYIEAHEEYPTTEVRYGETTEAKPEVESFDVQREQIVGEFVEHGSNAEQEAEVATEFQDEITKAGEQQASTDDIEATNENHILTDQELLDAINRKKIELYRKLSNSNAGIKRKREPEEAIKLVTDEGPNEGGAYTEEDAKTEGEATPGKPSKKRRTLKDSSKERSLPHHKDELGWKVICLGSDTRPAEIPTVDFVKSIDSLTAVTLLSYYTRWIGESDVLHYHANWLYHLLLKIEEPILRDTASDLRDLRYRCSVTRSKMESVEDQSLPLLNTIITLITKYFKVLEG